jgi:xylanolytic transcriptional activator XlnR
MADPSNLMPAPRIITQPRVSRSYYEGCRYKCLDPVMPLLDGIFEPKIACDLLEFYFAEPDSGLFRHASPYVLSPILRKHSLLHPTDPRPTTSALLVAMIWTSAQTADIPLLLLPGRRGQICERLRIVAMALLHDRDRDHWHRALGGRLLKEEVFQAASLPSRHADATNLEAQPSCQTIDDVLTLILVTIVISGGDFKNDCLVWWDKAIRLAQTMGLNRTDGSCPEADNNRCSNTDCECRGQTYAGQPHLGDLVAQEERRRVFWLLFSLDRHLALSFNGNLFIHDDEVQVYTPLPEDVWENLENASYEVLNRRAFGPPTVVTGIGFFEYFTPLMTILVSNPVSCSTMLGGTCDLSM